MNARTKVAPSEAQQIEAALDVLVSAAVANLHERPLTPERDIRADVAIGEWLDSLEWTEAQRRASRLLQRPISAAVRLAVRVLGERLYEIGGMALMHDVCERVSAADPRNEARRAGIIDHRWSGIGNWHS